MAEAQVRPIRIAQIGAGTVGSKFAKLKRDAGTMFYAKQSLTFKDMILDDNPQAFAAGRRTGRGLLQGAWQMLRADCAGNNPRGVGSDACHG
ncbi:MAG: hypothetical protein NWP59_00995, partial [Candidatus Nanopelagicales bacterium]|nr:hypothetical protein [Candidatus Nanopelagicales bacterium]